MIFWPISEAKQLNSVTYLVCKADERSPEPVIAFFKVTYPHDFDGIAQSSFGLIRRAGFEKIFVPTTCHAELEVS